MTIHQTCIIRISLCLILLLTSSGCDRSTPEAKKAQHRERAATFVEKGQYQEAIIEYRNVIQLDPQDADAHYRIALAYLKLGGLPNHLYQAFTELRRAVELDNTNQDAQLKLGELYILGHRSQPKHVSVPRSSSRPLHKIRRGSFSGDGV
ncbi:MAG: tetratricopeptide repeat protein [Nitrospira sp.]|nr:tetratricopeptide repeat protein [Nitrospira sp.]